MYDVYFNNIVEIGDLYLEYIFYEFENEPILFVCTDREKNIYLCICSDIRYEQKWVIAKSNINILKSLIKEEIDIVSAFLYARKATIVTMDLQGNENSFNMDMNKIDRLDLPKDGVFVKCDKEKAENYLWKKELETLLVQFQTIINIKPIVNEVEKTYSNFIDSSFSMSNKCIDLYSGSMCKEFMKKFDTIDKLSNDSTVVKQEYSVIKQEKYVEPVDNLNINKLDLDDYLLAV